MRLSVIIPHWNAKEHLPACLDSLRAQRGAECEIIIVDNASEDGSQAFIKENYPEVRLIELAENQGFAGACNIGMGAAGSDVVALLNNDTEVHSGWAQAIINGFAQYPDAGMIASRMMLFDKRDHFHTTGDFYRVDGQPGNRGVWQQDRGQYDQADYVFSACGGAAAYRCAMLDEIGMLDEDFFFSGEDVDLGWRAQLAGYRCVYIPDAIVYHKVSATGGGVTSSYYDGRNMLYILMKDYPAALWRKYWRRILGRQIHLAWDALRAWRGAAARARLRGMMAAVIHAPKMLRKRRQVQSTRCVSLDYLESILTGG